MHSHSQFSERRLLAGWILRGAKLAAAGLAAICIVACSKTHPENRYDRAMEMAATYSVREVPRDFLASIGEPIGKHGHVFLDLIWSDAFRGKFEVAAAELSKQSYFQDDNRSLLQDILADSKLRCSIETDSVFGNVDCGDEGQPYRAERLRLLHTDAGDFVISSADQHRGNGNSSNENASPLVIVIDLSDGGLGLIMEDHIAVAGGRKDVLPAVLTLASSIVRLENPNSGSGKVQLAGIRYDLEAAKAHTLYRKSADQPASGIERAPTRATPAGTAHPSHITKEEFQRLVVGKSMFQIRAILGNPSNTNEDADGVTWYYWSNDLRVEDPDSGTIINSSAISFDPGTKTAVGVHF